MKTEKEIREHFADDYIINKRHGKLLVIIFFALGLIMVYWKHQEIYYPDFSWIQFGKYEFMAFGVANFLARIIAAIKVSIHDERDKIYEKMRKLKLEIGALALKIRKDTTEYTADELRWMLRIKKLAMKIKKLEIELEFLPAQN